MFIRLFISVLLVGLCLGCGQPSGPDAIIEDKRRTRRISRNRSSQKHLPSPTSSQQKPNTTRLVHSKADRQMARSKRESK